MQIKKRLLKRQIAGDAFLVPLGKEVYDSNGLFFLNEVGEFIWDRLEAAENQQDILNALLEEYDVAEAVARQDVENFFQKLRAQHKFPVLDFFFHLLNIIFSQFIIHTCGHDLLFTKMYEESCALFLFSLRNTRDFSSGICTGKEIPFITQNAILAEKKGLINVTVKVPSQAQDPNDSKGFKRLISFVLQSIWQEAIMVFIRVKNLI